MNYRTMVKGALALSLSLIVGSSWAGDVQKYGATFETAASTTAPLNDFAYTVGDGITNAKYRVTQGVEKPYGWFSGSDEDESKIITRDLGENQTGQALQLNTDAATLTNKLDATKADELNDTLTGDNGATKGSIFFETEVKFVASDTDSAGIEGNQDATKFAIYAYCNEDNVGEGETVTTNLVVFHAYADEHAEGGIGYTNEVFKSVNINTEVYTKLRIEMKQIPINEQPFNVFSVSVGNGDAISSTTAISEDIWFLTVEKFSNDENKAVSSLNFKGTGEIDNISVGVIETAPTTGTVIFLAQDGTTELDSQELDIDAVPVYAGQASGTNGTATAAGITTFTGWTCGSEFYAVGTDLPAVTAGTTSYVATFSTVAAQASVNGDYYATLAEAIDAAANGDTVKLNSNVTMSSVLTVAKPVVLDLCGNAITNLTSEYAIYNYADGLSITNGEIYAKGLVLNVAHNASVTIESDFVGTATVNCGIMNATGATGCDITVNGGTITAQEMCLCTGRSSDGTITVNGGTLTAIDNAVIGDNGTAGYDGNVITINGGTFNGGITSAGYVACGIYLANDNTLVVNGGTFNITGGCGILARAGSVEVNDGEFHTTGDATGKVGDSRVVVPCAAVVFDSAAGYPGYANAETPASVTLNGGVFSSAVSPCVQHVGEDPVISVPATSTALFSDASADGVAEGYELVEDAEHPGLYKVQAIAPATVITVACVNGATYTEADGVYTFAPPSADYTVSSVFTNGVNAKTTTTLDLSAAEGDIKVVVAAKKIRTATGHKWFENPGVVGNTSYGIGSASLYYGPYNMDVDGDFITVPTWTSTSACLELYSRDAIDAGNAAYLAKFARTNYGYAMMGSGLSVPLNVAIAGANSGPYVVAFPLNNPNPVLGQDAFVISNSLNATLIQFKFTDDAQYVYARPYDGTKVYKFKVLNGLKTTGVNLVDPVTYEFGQRVRSLELAQIGGKDIVYALLEDKTISVVDTSVASPTPVPLISDPALSKYVNISVSGIADGTPHLTIASCNHASNVVRSRVDVYTLTAAGTAVDTNVETISFDTAAVTAWGIPTASHNADGCDAVVVDDEGTLYLGYGSAVYAIQYVAPPTPTYNVSWNGSDGVTVTTNGIELAGPSGTFEENTVITFAPTDSGATITNILVGGVAQTGFDPASFALTVISDTNLVVLAGAQATPPAQKPAWAEASGDGTDSDPYWAWATAHAAGQDLYAEGADYSAQYLLNVDADKTPVLKIDSIGVAAGVVQLIVSATDGTNPISLRTINGVLSVAVGDTLTALTPTACKATVNDQDGRATINLSVNSGNFFRARVDFAAPAGE